MTKNEMLQLNNSLQGMGHLKGVKFSYAVAKNIDIIKPELESIRAAAQPSEEYTEFDKKRIELAKKHSKKDEEGNPIVENGEYQVEDSFHDAFENLKEERRDLVDEREKQISEFNQMLEEDADVILHKVRLEDVPEEITAREMASIMPIVDDED